MYFQKLDPHHAASVAGLEEALNAALEVLNRRSALDEAIRNFQVLPAPFSQGELVRESSRLREAIQRLEKHLQEVPPRQEAP